MEAQSFGWNDHTHDNKTKQKKKTRVCDINVILQILYMLSGQRM